MEYLRYVMFFSLLRNASVGNAVVGHSDSVTNYVSLEDMFSRHAQGRNRLHGHTFGGARSVKCNMPTLAHSTPKSLNMFYGFKADERHHYIRVAMKSGCA